MLDEALFVICTDKTGPFVAADFWLAAENLVLTACSMGLGTCVTGSAVAAFNASAMKAELAIPAAQVQGGVVRLLADPAASP